MMKNRAIGTASGLVLLATLAFGSATFAQDDTVGQVEQTLHDDVVAAYEAVSSRIGELEGTVGDAASGAIETAKSDLEGIGERLTGAVDNVGNEASRDYREIQHALEGIGGNVDDVLHEVGHTLEDAEHDALAAVQDGVADVSNSIDHVIDGLPF